MADARFTSDLAEGFAASHAAEAAGVLSAIDPSAAVRFLESIDPAVAAGLTAQLRPSEAAGYISVMEPSAASRLLQPWGLHRSVVILRRLDPLVREPIAARLPREFALAIERRLRYPEGSAGWMADCSIEALPETMSVAEARRREHDPRFPYLYLVDSDYRLTGTVHLIDLVTATDHEPLIRIAKRSPLRVSARTGAAELVKHRAWADFDALPVIDGRGRYLGVLRHKSLRNLRGIERVDGEATAPLASLLELAEIYWLGLASVFLPSSSGAAAPHSSESTHES
jgi:Mg/Co/Ni transporter MgtE